MKLRLVKAAREYQQQIMDMLDEWYAYGEKIISYAIRRLDYHDFEYYCENLEAKDIKEGMVPDSTFLLGRRTEYYGRSSQYQALLE